MQWRPALPLIRWHTRSSAAQADRKARWSRGASEESGVRAIFYYLVAGDTVFFTLLYAKNELENLSHEQEKELKRLAQAIEKGK